MSTRELPEADRFSFRVRPVAVPGELRISWRLAVIVLMLHHCRQQRASLIKLYILNDVVRSQSSASLLRRVVAGELGPMWWQTRIEPAFGRALDLAVGDGLVEWVSTSQGRGLMLTQAGKSAVAQVNALDVLTKEKELLKEFGPAVKEQFAKTLTSVKEIAYA